MHVSSIQRSRRLFSAQIFKRHQTALSIAAMVCLVAAVGWLISLSINNAVEDAIKRNAVASSERWVDFFAERMPRINQALAGQIDTEQVEFVRSVEKMGDVFRFKLFSREGKLIFASDEIEPSLTAETLTENHEPKARAVIETGIPNVAVADGTGKKNRPPLYSEAYMAVKDQSGQVIGAIEVYVDQTSTQAQMRLAFYGVGLAVAGLAGLGILVPGGLLLWRTRQTLLANKKAARLEAENLQLALQQSASLSAHNTELAGLNKELASNISKLKSAQEELVKKGRMEQLGQLTATVAHELRNPLGAVRTSAYLLERKLKGKGLGVDAQIERISNGVMRCDNIITQLLDFSRDRKLKCQKGAFDVWLEQVLSEEARKLPNVVSIHCSLGLTGVQVPFDPARMQRAIVNLITNASEAMVGLGHDPAKYTTANPTISISTRLLGDSIAIEVSDNGPGMTEEVLGRIREPLFTTKSFGTGLGVPAIEQIAAQHGGRLDIASVPGKGSCFTITLPLEVSVAEAA